MVAGDNRTTAEAIGDELGISSGRIIAGAFPGDKVGASVVCGGGR